MKLCTHCQRCLVCLTCLIQEDAYVRGEIQFLPCGLDGLHEATTSWLCKGLDLREQRVQAHLCEAGRRVSSKTSTVMCLPGAARLPSWVEGNVYITARWLPWAPSALTVAVLAAGPLLQPPGAAPGVGHEKAGSPGPAACTDQVAGWWMISPAWAHSQKSLMLRKC